MWKWLQIGTYMLLIMTSTGDRLLGFINIDDLERPWTPQKEVFSEFFAIFGCGAHFNTELRTKWLEIDQDNLCTKFSAFNVDFSGSSPDRLGSRRPAQAGVKDSYPPPKKWLFYRNAFARLVSFAQITCQVRHTQEALQFAVEYTNNNNPTTSQAFCCTT